LVDSTEGGIVGIISCCDAIQITIKDKDTFRSPRNDTLDNDIENLILSFIID